MSIIKSFFTPSAALRISKRKAHATAAQRSRAWAQARDLWAELTVLVPGEINPWLQLGNMCNELGQGEDAIAAFRKAAEVDPVSVDPLIGIAGVYERMEAWEDAHAVWKDVAFRVALTPSADAANVVLHLALTALRMEQSELAANLLERVAAAHPAVREKPLFWALSVEVMRLQDQDGFVNVPDSVAASDPAIAFDVASAHMRAGHPERGLAIIGPSLRSQTVSPSVLWLAADLQESMGQWGEVLSLCERARVLDPDDLRYDQRAFDVALRLNDLVVARKIASSLAQHENWNPVHALMQAYKADNQGRHARLLCRWLVRKWPHSRWHQLEYIRLVAQTLSSDLADALVRRDVANHGSTEDILRTYYDVAFLSANFMEATRRLRMFLEAHPSDEGAGLLLGYALANAVSIDAAEQHFADIATRHFQSQSALVGLAHMAMRRRDRQATFDRWLRVTNIHPDYDIGHVELARSAYELRHMSLVRVICQKRLTAVPKDETMGEFFVWFLLAIGEFQEAWNVLLKLRRHNSGWTVADLTLQTAAQLGILDRHLDEILALFPRATTSEAGRRLYHIIRHLIVITRTDLMARVINASCVDPRELAWLAPYLGPAPRLDTGNMAPRSPLADGGKAIHQAWSRIHGHVRGDLAELVRGATTSAIDAILDRPRQAQPVVHIINKFEQVSGGSELHALDIAGRVANFARVHLWAPEMPHPHFYEMHDVNPIEQGQRKVPYGGVLVFIGVYFNIGDWLTYARPDRVVFLYNTFEAPQLFEQVQKVWDCCGVRAELLYCSDMMQHEVGLPGLFEPSPTDITAFSPRVDPFPATHKFTLGRHSRDVLEKHHAEDWKVYQAVAECGGVSQVLGGTCMSALFPPVPGLELLPARSGNMVPFLRSLDCYYYRTSTWIEPWGRVVIEAMACGLPVVVSRNGGYAQVIQHGVNGLLFDTTDEAVALIYQVYADTALRERLGRNARATVEELLGDAAMRRLVSFYLAV